MKNLFKLFTLIGLLGMMGLNATVATAANTPKIKNIRIREIVDGTGATSYKIVVVVKHDDADQVNNVGVTIEPIGKSPEPSAKSFKLTNSAKDKKRYVNKDIIFKTNALDFEYLVTATMYDEKGNTLGEPETAWVTVDAKGDDHEPDPCNSKLTMDGATYTSTFDEKGNQQLHVDLPLKVKNGNPSISFYNKIKWTYATHYRNNKTGYIQTVSSTPKFNEKTGTFEVDYIFANADKENYWIPGANGGTITNPCDDVYYIRDHNCVYLQGTWTYNYRISTTAPDTCGKPDIDSLFLEVGAFDKTTGKTPVLVHFPKTYIDFNISGTLDVRVDAKAQDSKGNTQTLGSAMKLNEKTGWYECTFSLKGENTKEIQLTSLELNVTNPCGETHNFDAKVKNPAVWFYPGSTRLHIRSNRSSNGGSSTTDSCNTKYKLKEVDYETATAGGLYAIQFSFNFGNSSDAPSEVVMVAQLTNCKGETMNIKLKMKYNASTNSYYSGQTLTQVKDCEWKLTYAEVGAYNPCKELTWWGLDFSQLKGNGKGTRDAATASNGKPGLL